MKFLERNQDLRVLALIIGLILIALVSCEKPKEPAATKEIQIQKQGAGELQPQVKQIKPQEEVRKEVTKVEEKAPEKEAEKQEQKSPLERARGREIIQDGQPIVTWGNLKDLPTLDEVFPVVDKPPKEFGGLKGVEEIQLPETEERKRLKKNISEEMFDKLTAVKSPNGKCLIELYGGSLAEEKREDWLRSLDPETKAVLWKYDEPGLFSPEVRIEFPQDAEFFILTNLLYPRSRTSVKLFSCKTGYLREIYTAREDPPPLPIATITPNGQYILVVSIKGKAKSFDLEGKILWEKQINPYYGPLHPIYVSHDSSRFVTFYRFPEIQKLEERRRANIPEELQIVEIETGETKFKKRFHGNLGDSSMITNTMEIRGITRENLVGIWLMDGIGFVLDKTNPYGNIMVLFAEKDVFAFRIKSLGFSLSEDGRYVNANGKYYYLDALAKPQREQK